MPLIERHVVLHQHVGRQLEASDVRQRRLKRPEQRRTDAASLLRRVHHQCTDRADAVVHDAAHAADDAVALTGDQCSLGRDVRCNRLGSLGQWRDIGGTAAPPLFGKRLLLQGMHGGGVTRLRAVNRGQVGRALQFGDVEMTGLDRYRNRAGLATVSLPLERRR